MLWLRQTAGRLSVQQPACIATHFWDLRAPSNKDCFVVQYKSKPCTQPHIVRGRNLDVKPRYTRARTCWCYCPATLTNMPLVASFSRPSPLQSCGMQVQVQRRKVWEWCKQDYINLYGWKSIPVHNVHVVRFECLLLPYHTVLFCFSSSFLSLKTLLPSNYIQHSASIMV